jgi:precorrin-6B methylase 2
MYKEDLYDNAVSNFAEFNNVTIIRGSVPSTLSTVEIGDVAYLSIDMNNTVPEIAAANYFWDKLKPGAPIVLDDYGFVRYETQKRAFDKWAADRCVEILALPTGQGLIVKPPA